MQSFPLSVEGYLMVRALGSKGEERSNQMTKNLSFVFKIRLKNKKRKAGEFIPNF